MSGMEADIRSRGWWQDEHDQPCIPGIQIILFDPHCINRKELESVVSKGGGVLAAFPGTGERLDTALKRVPIDTFLLSV